MDEPLFNFRQDSSTAVFPQLVKSSNAVCSDISTANTVRPMGTNRRKLTDTELAECSRLKAVFEQRKADAKAHGKKLTQADVGYECGWSSGQSAVNQYLNGKVPLNVDALLKLAAVLNFEPRDVSPRLANEVQKYAQAVTPAETTELITQRLAGVFATVEDDEPEPEVPDLSEDDDSSAGTEGGLWEAITTARAYAEVAFEDIGRIGKENYRPADIDWHGSVEDAGHGGFWVRVPTTSMTSDGVPVSFPPGMLILVNPDKAATPGHFVVATVKNEPVFRWFIREAGDLYLAPLNREFKVIPVDESCRIAGVVVDAKWDGLTSWAEPTEVFEENGAPEWF